MNAAPIKSRLGPAAAPTFCLMCEFKTAEIRGQCRRCRQGTSRDILAGRLSEAFLIEKGLLLRSRQGRRKKNPPWREKLEQLQVADDGADTESPPSDGAPVADTRVAQAPLSGQHGKTAR